MGRGWDAAKHPIVQGGEKLLVDGDGGSALGMQPYLSLDHTPKQIGEGKVHVRKV